MLKDLRAFAALGNETLALVVSEHQALTGAGDYQPFEFCRLRKNLIIRINSLLVKINNWRQLWQQISPIERAGHADVKTAIQMLQDLLGKILQLDRENQQALLRRGLVPARHVTSCAAPPSNYVANLYRRHNPH
jgi:hypothetical protein